MVWHGLVGFERGREIQGSSVGEWGAGWVSCGQGVRMGK